MIKQSRACIQSFHYFTASYIVFLSAAYILGDIKASKYSEAQVVESLPKLPKILKTSVLVNSKYVHLCDCSSIWFCCLLTPFMFP